MLQRCVPTGDRYVIACNFKTVLDNLRRSLKRHIVKIQLLLIWRLYIYRFYEARFRLSRYFRRLRSALNTSLWLHHLHLSALLHVAVLQLHLEIRIRVILRELAVSLGHRVFYRI